MSKRTDFISNFDFINNASAWINFDEGRVVLDGTPEHFTETHLRDQLGNTSKYKLMLDLILIRTMLIRIKNSPLWRLATIITLSLIWLISCRSPTVDLTNAKIAFANGNYSLCLKLLDSIDPTNEGTEYFRLKGLCYYYSHIYDSAIVEFDKVILKDSQDTTLYIYRGVSYDSIGFMQKAIQDFNTTLQIDSTLIDVYIKRASIFSRLGKLNESIVDFDKALSIDSNFIVALNNKGLTYENLGRYNDAIIFYNKALNINKNEPDIFFNRGVSFLYLKEYEKALVDFNSAIELVQINGLYYLNRGIAFYYLQLNDKACNDWEEAKLRGSKKALQYLENYCKRGSQTIIV